MSMRRVAGYLAVVFAPAIASAQGNLGSQGLGYAPGQLSAPARAMAGSVGEFDPVSPLNPASLALWGRPAVHFQSESEFRTSTTPTSTGTSVTPRFSLIAAGMNLGPQVAIGLSFSTMLDRSFVLNETAYQKIGVDSVKFQDQNQVRGAIADTRFGIAYAFTPSLRIGVGLHAITGQNQLTNVRAYDTATAYVGYTIARTIKYVGRAYSIGAAWEPLRTFGVSASYRKGGTIDAETDIDGRIARATVPDRFGIGVRSEVARGLMIAAGAQHVGWTSLKGLITDSSTVHDSWEYSAGGEYLGPTLAGSPMEFRFGGATRTLPFGLGATATRESTLGGGLGTLLGGGRVGLDLTLQHAYRSSVAGVNERAWTFSLGFLIRP
jgi:hypothetical protein